MQESTFQDRYLWIKTRDGSPTLWDNDIGQSFKSARGAISESWMTYTKPGLAQLSDEEKTKTVVVGEFGLGPGTNWLVWNFTAWKLNIPTQYFVIEKDSSTFEMGLKMWRETYLNATQLLQQHAFPEITPDEFLKFLDEVKMPLIFKSVEEAVEAGKTNPALRARLWFHDPFSWDVNPDGYSREMLCSLANLWAKKFWATTYACNGNFQRTLKNLPEFPEGKITYEMRGIECPTLKRERLEFFRD